MSSNQKPMADFILSLLSDIFIIIGSSLWCLWLSTGGGWTWIDWMMHGWDQNIHFWNLLGMAYTMGVVGIVFGMIVIVAAVMLYVCPMQHELWGALIIVFSVASILGRMGGIGIGLLLGIIGGILAILGSPKKLHKRNF